MIYYGCSQPKELQFIDFSHVAKLHIKCIPVSVDPSSEYCLLMQRHSSLYASCSGHTLCSVHNGLHSHVIHVHLCIHTCVLPRVMTIGSLVLYSEFPLKPGVQNYPVWCMICS